MVRITRAVGRGADKPLKSDILLVQQLLNRKRPPGTPPIGEDGKQGDETYTAIEEFQRRALKMKKPDGRVDPDGRTFTALAAEPPAPPVQPAPAVTTPAPAAEPPAPAPEAAPRMSLSPAGRQLLREVEALFLYTYDDQTSKRTTVWVPGATIGYGHLIPKGEWDSYKNGITQEGAEALLDRDLAPFEAAVNAALTVKVQQNQFDALTILAFNIGAGSLARSSVIKLVNDPTAKTSYKNLEAAWKSWNKSQGKVMKGLDNRRQAEWNIYSQGIYKRW